MAAPAGKKDKTGKKLPYLGSDVRNEASFRTIIEQLTETICHAVREGKSVTSVNKDLIQCAAQEIRVACETYLEINIAEQERYDPTFNSPTCYKNVVTDLTQLVKDEVSKLREEIKAEHSATSKNIISTYASIAGRQAQPRDLPGPTARPSPAAKAASTTPPSTKPAIVVASKTPASSREETFRNLKSTISFRETNYAPAKVAPLSKNKLRIEFDTERDRDDALQRIKAANDAKVSAEVASRLKPMIILKGVSCDVAAEELTDIIMRQNPELSEFDSSYIKYKFKRDNRNPLLYNAVFITHPTAFRTLLSLDRVRVDYQRVHIEEFSPFLQCHKCLQFGHTATHCKSPSTRCAHCAEDGHIHKECRHNTSVSADGSTVAETGTYKCFNCVSHNIKFNNKHPTEHKATSTTCPIVRSMRNKTRQNIDYGTAPTPSPNSVARAAP